jgi:hypothetical protein
MSDLNLYSVNWQDGMLITQQHLKDQEKYFEHLIRWHATSAGDNYGLIKRSSSGKSALESNLSVNGNRVRVDVIRCQAITPGGHYIDISESSRNTVSAEADITGANIPVFVSVNPDTKVQVGEPDPGEDVPRIPYLVNSCALHLGQQPSLPDGVFFQVAELAPSGGEVMFSDSYYAPCLSTWAEDRLAEKALDLRNRLENLLSLSSRAYNAIANAGALADESSSLQEAFKETMYNFAYHLSSVLDEFVVGRNGRHPIYLVIVFKKIFRVFSTLLNLQPGLKDYLNERFFVKEMNSEVGSFMAAVDAFLLSEYNHRDLGAQIRMIDNTLTTLRGILGFLAQLKREQLGDQAMATDTLTYSGKTYRNVDYTAGPVEVGELSYLAMDIPSPVGVSDTVVLMSKDLFSTAEWNNMQVRIGLNGARGLGETDPVDIDTVTYGDKVALHPQDMLKSPSVRQVTLIFRGARDTKKFQELKKADLIMYSA